VADVPVAVSKRPEGRGRRFVHSSRERRRPEIPLAPLIDVLLFLILFFAAASTLEKDYGVDVTRPEATSGAALPTDALAVAVSAQGEIRCEGRPVDLAMLESAVRMRLRSHPNLPVVVVADRNARTAAVVAAMDRCRLAGAPRVALATEKPRR
jgi:biopolymer transport protein ExbD